MSAVPPGNYLSHVVVEALFGEFTYRIGPLASGVDPRVMVLYGDNGTGKTTVLQLIRSLLSPSNSAGHRSRVARIAFKKFEIYFKDGRCVAATRERAVAGPYWFSVTGGGELVPHKVLVKTDPDFRVNSSAWSAQEQGDFQAVLQRLHEVSAEVGFLDDRRTFMRPDFADKTRNVARRNYLAHEGLWVGHAAVEEGDPVAAIIVDLTESVRREALMRQRRGSGDSQSIYKNLIRAVATGGARSHWTVENLRLRLEETEKVSGEFSRIGLTSQLQHSEMIQQIERAAPDKTDLVSDLVSAYIESTEAWFSALTELKALLDKFVDRLNFFMAPKKVAFSVSEGLTFCSREGHPLYVGMLSSGERHLVMMLSQALLRRSERSVLVVDEPELSLNMKWQRELVGAMLDCLGGGASQVIMATHSIEIAARYRENVVRLWRSGEDGRREEND